MTKQEAIQNAYGEHWETIKNYVDKNGWLDGKPCDKDLSRVYNNLFDSCNRQFDTIRPKTLQGIENNNGWIKIESEDDLPKEYGSDYWVVYDNKIRQLNRNYNNEIFWKENVTHYQPIIKPQPPIY